MRIPYTELLMRHWILLIAAVTAASISAFAFADDASCKPRVVQSATSFPLRSQVRRHEGTVYVNVRIDEHGRATDAQLRRSSGYRLLDRSATRSIVEDWVFDVSSCATLPAQHLVAVQFKNDEY
jgi:TonB family protein